MTSGTSNLQRFLDSTTPIVPSHTISQSCIHDVNLLWQPDGKEKIEYFELKDLWNSYKEWSAFGACTTVSLANGETIKQYYVPYLSAIQIYTDKMITESRTKSNEGNSSVESESDSWSDDSVSDKLSRSLSNNSTKTWDNMSEDSSLDQAASWPLREKFGHIYLEHFEACSPNWRIPMMDKINELAKDHPALMTLRSLDVSPASWMAVAWYPIYHIPSSSNKDLSTCFLTYHTLSSSFLDNDDELYSEEMSDCSCHDKISLSPFGLATYKMHGDLWLNPGKSEYVKFVHLQNAAHSWLKQLNVYHHDLSFFTHHPAL